MPGDEPAAVLSYCDGKHTIAEVQALIRREHPDLFPSQHASETFIHNVLLRDTGE